MENINWKSSLVTAGMTITGLLGVLWVAYQLVDSSYENRMKGLDYQLSLIHQESMRLEEQLKQIRKLNEDSYSHYLDTKNDIREICSLLLKAPEISSELFMQCKEMLKQ